VLLALEQQVQLAHKELLVVLLVPLVLVLLEPQVLQVLLVLLAQADLDLLMS
jgi:hypothetical protein